MTSAAVRPAPSPWWKSARSARGASIAGLVHAVLLIAVVLLLQTHPPLDASEQELVAFYSDSAARARMITALNLAPVSIIAFLWFIGAIRHRIGAGEDRLFATAFLGSGLVFSTIILLGVAAEVAPTIATTATGSTLDVDLIRLSGSLGSAAFTVLAPRLAAVFMLATSGLGARTGALPRWLTLSGRIMAIAMLFMFALWSPIRFVFPGWVAVASIVLLVRRHRVPLDGAAPPRDQAD